MNNGPEDLLLEELVRKWKWAAAQRANRQRQPQLANFGFTEEEEEDDVEREEPLQLEPKITSSGDRKGHRNFAYRPHDAGFMKHGPADRQMAEPVNPLIHSGMPFIHLQKPFCVHPLTDMLAEYATVISRLVIRVTFHLLQFRLFQSGRVPSTISARLDRKKTSSRTGQWQPKNQQLHQSL